jgi:hypothetical protein
MQPLTIPEKFWADMLADWISITDIEPKLFDRYADIWVAPGSPYKSMEKRYV